MTPSSFITPGHVRAFQAVTSRLYDNITLWSCRINGEPGVAIVMTGEAAEGIVAVMPLFVAITPNMNIEFAGDRHSGSGGPKHPAERAFHAGKASVTPGGAS